MLVFYERGSEDVVEHFRALFAQHGHASQILPSHIPDHGYDIMRGL